MRKNLAKKCYLQKIFCLGNMSIDTAEEKNNFNHVQELKRL